MRWLLRVWRERHDPFRYVAWYRNTCGCDMAWDRYKRGRITMFECDDHFEYGR